MAKNLPFNALRAFEAAARHLSFRQAAEELHITPSAVSQQIRSLEDLLGVTLFYRRDRHLELTSAAQRGLPDLRSGLDQLATAVEQIIGQDQTERLTIWVAPSFASKWLVPRLAHFTANHPGVDLTITASAELIGDSSGTQRAQQRTQQQTGTPNTIPAEKFRRHNIDLAIRFGKGNYPGCRVDKLFPVSAVPLCSPRLLEGPHPLSQPEDLRYHTLLHDDTAYEGRPDWSGWLQAAGVENVDASHGLRFNHVSLALQAAIDGQGVVLSLAPLAADDLAAGRLVIPFELSLPLDYAYYLISLEETVERFEVAQFREWLFSEAARQTSDTRTRVADSTMV